MRKPSDPEKPVVLAGARRDPRPRHDIPTGAPTGRPAGSKDKSPRTRIPNRFIPLTKDGKVRQFRSAWSVGMAMINDPTVSVSVKMKLVVGLVPYEMPRLAVKSVGKKEECNQAAKTAGRDGEFSGLMDPPKGPRLAVDNSFDTKPKKVD